MGNINEILDYMDKYLNDKSKWHTIRVKNGRFIIPSIDVLEDKMQGLYFIKTNIDKNQFNLLPNKHNEFKGYSELIEYDSIDCEDGIFIRKMHSIFKEYHITTEHRSDLIVIYLDGKENKFKLFKIEFYVQNIECKYNIINDLNSVIIGSGSLIYDNESSDFMLEIYKKVKNNYDDITALKAVEYDIKRRLEKLDSSVYSKLGISPVFHYAFISGSQIDFKSLVTAGVDVEISKPVKQFNYSIEQNDDSSITLKSQNNNSEIIAHRIDKIDTINNNSNIKFDPEGREK